MRITEVSLVGPAARGPGRRRRGGTWHRGRGRRRRGGGPRPRRGVGPGLSRCPPRWRRGSVAGRSARRRASCGPGRHRVPPDRVDTPGGSDRWGTSSGAQTSPATSSTKGSGAVASQRCFELARSPSPTRPMPTIISRTIAWPRGSSRAPVPTPGVHSRACPSSRTQMSRRVSPSFLPRRRCSALGPCPATTTWRSKASPRTSGRRSSRHSLSGDHYRIPGRRPSTRWSCPRW